MKPCGLDNQSYCRLTEDAPVGFLTEAEKKVPVSHVCDVAVAGSGVSGLFAALAAARAGARTVLIERLGSLGGNIGPGMILGGGWLPEVMMPKGASGIPAEFLKRVEELRCRDINYPEESGIVSYLGLKMCREAGVETILSAYVSDPVMEDSTVRGIFVEGKSGRTAVKAGVVIDATGDASIAQRAGAPMIVHVPPKEEYSLLISEDILDKDYEWWNEAGVEYIVGGLETGNGVSWFREVLKGQFDTNSTMQISEIEKILRTRAFELVMKKKAEEEGWKDANLLAVADYIGARGGPCIEGEHVLTIEEAWRGDKFADVIYKVIFRRPNAKEGFNKDGFEVPYSIMLPRMIDGMLVIGRGASYIRRGHDGTGTRVRLSMMSMGEAAGHAASIASIEGISPREIDIRKLQRYMHSSGYFLGDAGRIHELGLN